MDVPRLIREMVAAAEQRVMQALANLVQITTVTRSTAKGEADGADGWPDAGKAYQRSTRRMQHFGFRSRPPKNTAAVMLLVGGGGNSEITVAEGSDGYGPGDLGDGGAALFSSGDARLVADGNDLTANQGTAKVGRVGDATGSGSLVAVVAQAGPLVTVTFTFVPEGGGAPVPWFAFTATGTGTPGTYTLALPGKITSGADHFKA